MRPQDFDQEELLLMLQDVLTTAASGHTDKLRCPVCERADVAVETREDDWLHVTCPKCGLDFEGLLQNPEDSYRPSGGRKRPEAFG
jgi:hypothetical protein